MLLDHFIALIPSLIIFAAIWVGISYSFQAKNFFAHVSSHWHHSFLNQHFSGKEIYAAIEEAVKERHIPNITFSTALHYQTNYFSDKREYLRVARGDAMFLVCAAPFGNDYFISCWVGEPMSVVRDIVTRIPVIGVAIAKRLKERTFFQVDTETMFLEAVKFAVSQVTDELKGSKGIRPLVELGQKVNGNPMSADQDAIEYV